MHANSGWKVCLNTHYYTQQTFQTITNLFDPNNLVIKRVSFVVIQYNCMWNLVFYWMTLSTCADIWVKLFAWLAKRIITTQM